MFVALLFAEVILAEATVLEIMGISTAANIPIMAITDTSSTIVKPRLFFSVCMRFIIRSPLFNKTIKTLAAHFQESP